MAHRGKLYPLSWHRFINLDAEYPNWLSARYECVFPEGTGTLAASLNHRVFKSTVEVIDAIGVLHQSISDDLALTIRYILKQRIGWSNVGGFPRTFKWTLEYIQFFPPSAGTICEWSDVAPPAANLGPLIGALNFSTFMPAAYDSVNIITAHAIGW